MDEITYCHPEHLFCRAKRILLAVDGSSGASRATSIAFEIAEMTSSKLCIVHVIPTPSVEQFARMTDENSAEAIRKYVSKGEILLQGYKKAASDYNIEVELILEKGLPSVRIVTLSKELGVDLIVLGYEGGTGSQRTQLGSVTERVVKNAECTVIVAK